MLLARRAARQHGDRGVVCRCPVVAVAAAGPSELIRDGSDGVLVPLEDPAALGDAIAALLADPTRAAALAAAGASGSRRIRARPVVALWRERMAAIAASARGLPAPITSASA